MIEKTGPERRLFPRVNQQLPAQVIANGYDFETTTKNVSCVGAYCNIKKYVPPFTKVMVKLDLPLADSTHDAASRNVECKGVIVRSEDELTGGFNVAIFFNGITAVARRKISRYINQLVSGDSSCLNRV